MAITISTNNGTRISLAHNRRDRQMIEQENAKWAEKHPNELRIDPNGHWEEWKNEGLKKTYEKLFADSVVAYNEKQLKAGKKSRVISDYLGELRAKGGSSKNAKHPLYEIIYQAGSKEHPVEEAVGRQILRELYEGFAERNPHLYVLTAHYHADEAGSGYGKTAGHLHLTYIPVATGCKRGPETQNSLSSALRQQGIEATAYSKTEQMEWERRENAALEALCRKYGYEVVHPQAGTKQEHLSVEEFKLKKEIEAAEERLEQVAALPLGKALVSKGRLEEIEKTEAEYAAARK